MKRRSTLVATAFALLLPAVPVHAQEPAAAPLELWYDEPAESWNHALPVGNGRLGGMVF